MANLRHGIDAQRWVLHALTDDPPDPDTATTAAVNKFQKDDAKARPHIVLNLGEEPATILTSLLLSGATTKVVWRKLTDSYQKENIQSKLNLRTKLHNLRYKDGNDLQTHLTSLEEIFVDLARLNDPVSEKDKTGVLLRSLPESFGFLALMADANNMDYDSICALLKSEMDRRQAHNKPSAPAFPAMPAARMADTDPSHYRKRGKRIECWYCGKIGHTKDECRQRRKDNRRNYKSEYKNDRGRPRGIHKNRESRHMNGWNNRPNDRNFPSESRNTAPNGHEVDRRTGFLARNRALKASSWKNKTDETWLDCGANDHFVWDRKAFKNYNSIPSTPVDTCDGVAQITGEGDVTFKLDHREITLRCKHAPEFDQNVISLSKFLPYFNCEFISDDLFKGCHIRCKENGKLLHTSILTNGLYPLPSPISTSFQANMSNLKPTPQTWHSILGHIGAERLSLASRMIDGMEVIEKVDLKDHQCIPCIESATKRAPISIPKPRVTAPLDLTHTDISGKISTASIGGAQYFVVFLDDSTSMSSVYFLKERSEILTALKAYKSLVENQQNRRMQALRLDQAGEHISTEFHTFVIENGITTEFSPPYASQSNGASERLIQELWKMARTMLFESRSDIHLWAEAISHANWLRNRLPSNRIKMEIPYQVWNGRRPDASSLLQFGQPGYAFQYRPDAVKGKKFLPRTIFGNFVGMHSENSLYRIWIPSRKEVKICRQNDFTVLRPNTELPSFSTLVDEISKQRLEEESQGVAETEAEDTLSSCYFIHYCQTPTSLKAKTRDIRIPKSFDSARIIPFWAEAIDREYNALLERQTWTYIRRTSDMKPIPFIWDLRIKDTVGSDVSVLYKARCCIRGDKQVAYRDFDPENLYAPVVRHETIRMFIAKAAAQNLILEAADVSNAYLYGDVDRDILMEQPTDSSGKLARPGYVCKLNKSLYGLRQAGEIWGSVIHNQFLEWGFKQSNQDSRLYFLQKGSDFINLILVVDDMAFSSNSRALIDRLKYLLQSTFKVKLLGTLQVFIGWEIRRTENGLYLGQSSYVKRLLRNFNMTHVKPVTTPLPVSCDIQPIHDDELPLNLEDHKRYRSLIGVISYLAICTRPDISFAISVLARQLHAPAQRHLLLAKRVVRYIAGTADKTIFYPKNPKNSEPLTAYADADWGGCRETRRSTTGIIIKINSAPIYWASKRQSLVTLSTSEAEYVALSTCAKQIVWLRHLFVELLHNEPLTADFALHPTNLITDSTSAISMTNKRQVSERNKHIEIKVHHIRELVTRRILVLRHVRTYEQAADLLTKSLPAPAMKGLFPLINM